MTAKQSFATILAMLLALVLLGGCSPSSVETPLLTVIFGDTAIPAYSALMSGRTYAENGWVYAHGFNAEYSLPQDYRKLPTVTVTMDFKDFRLEYAPDTEAKSVTVFNTEFIHIYEELYQPESIIVLPRGTYYISIRVRQQGRFIESENEFESADYYCMFRLVVE